MSTEELKQTCSYITSELHRVETVAGTLSTIEREHHLRLNRFDHKDLREIAVEEQSASRQLGMIRQICLELAQKVSELPERAERQPGPEENPDAARH